MADGTAPTPEAPEADEHAPWHYLDGGVICACGLGMLGYEICPTQLPGMQVKFAEDDNGAPYSLGVVKRTFGGEYGTRNVSIVSDGRTFVRLIDRISVCKPEWWQS